MRKLLVSVSLAFLCHPLTAQGQPAAFSFLRTIIGARPAALAGSMVSISKDPHAIFYNPAGIADMATRTGAFGYLNHILDVQSFVGAYVHPHAHGSYGIGIYYTDYGTFLRTDKYGEELGSFGASSMVVHASYSRRYAGRWLFGANLKYLRSDIEQYDADGFGLDVGVIYNSPFFDNLSIAAGLFNIGAARTAFVRTKERLPFCAQLGFSKRLAHLPFTWSAVVLRYRDEDFRLRLGGEFDVSERLFLRFGYDTVGRDQKLGIGSSSDRFAGLSLGFGVTYNEYVFDYAFSSFGEVGSLNRLSFSVKF